MDGEYVSEVQRKLSFFYIFWCLKVCEKLNKITYRGKGVKLVKLIVNTNTIPELTSVLQLVWRAGAIGWCLASFLDLSDLKEIQMFLPNPLVKLSIVRSHRDVEVACSATDLQGLNFAEPRMHMHDDVMFDYVTWLYYLPHKVSP